MMKTINRCADSFNNGVNTICQKYVQTVNSRKHVLKAAFGPVIKPVIATDSKRLSHNVKVIAHNTATVVALASVVGVVFGGPLGMVSLGASLGARMFINHAMKREAHANVPPQQKTDNSIYRFLFKPLV